MRTYGRIFALNADGTKQVPQPAGCPIWQVVETDPNTGSNTWVYITALAQVLLLNLNESPFYANWGIPAEQAVIQQVAPDFYVTRTQSFFAPYFASLIIYRDVTQPRPAYKVQLTTFAGTPVSMTVQVPT